MADTGGIFGWISDWVGAYFDKLRTLGAGIAGRIFTGLGLYLAHHYYTSPALAAFLAGHVSGVPADVLAVLSYINVDRAISMMIGAYAAKWIAKVALAPLSALTGIGGGGS